MIVIALAALAYTWFSGIFASLTSTAGSAVTTTTTAMATQFRIEAAKFYTGGWVNATIRNIGTQKFSNNTLGAYVSGTWSTINAVSPSGDVDTGKTVTLNISNGTAACLPSGGATLSITIGTGLTDSRTITGC
jgi:hypothetical protein